MDDVGMMVIVVGDASDCGDETSAVHEANKIKLIVSEVVVVSVGAANRTFLDRLASKPDNVLTISSDLELMDNGTQQIKQITCRIGTVIVLYFLICVTEKARSQLFCQVLSAQYICGGTDTAAALTEARLKAFNVGARLYSKKIAIVVNDGESKNTAETEQAAAALKGTGVRVIAIGVGSANQAELRAIATTPDDVYYVDTFDVLKTIYERIAELTQARR
ncbi:cartilage matrix protein-like [Physella acuta]|uniref:cartilage matrix protein-like n=1 Tax=Physella acuta TaxID=109671 RepID=UPI0027DDBCF8|nr:cartilage matrix protein-like [Physella acuta]